MAALDKLLQSLIDREMEAMVLEPDSRPRMRRKGVEVDVSTSPLAGPTIEGLLSQVAPPGAIAAPPAPGRAEFDYQSNGRHFHLTCLRTKAGWSALVVPVDDGRGEGSAAASRGVTSSEPVAEVETPEPRVIASVGELLRLMLGRGASDLHLSSLQRVRLRIEGELVTVDDYHPPLSEWVEQLIDDIIPERSQQEFEIASDADFAYEFEDLARFRVNVFRDRLGMGAVFRVIPNVPPTFDELDLPPVLRRVAKLSRGLVLVTGPTGSGKTTTLAALIDLINRDRRDHIITIEDPIEFIHESGGCLVHQREVGLHTGTVGQALRAALREDPNVVLAGELRDLETILIALETAETGHLVFGTLHTTSVVSTLERLIDQFPAERRPQIRMMLGDSLRSVVAQTLLKKKDGGRIAAHEILTNTPEVAALIRSGELSGIRPAMEASEDEGSRSLNESLFGLVESGEVTPLEAYGQSVDKAEFDARLAAAGLSLAGDEED